VKYQISFIVADNLPDHIFLGMYSLNVNENTGLLLIVHNLTAVFGGRELPSILKTANLKQRRHES
jgi:hypothetical protein